MVNKSPIIRSKTQTWSDNNVQLLKKLYPTTDNNIIAKKLKKSVRSVRAKAVILKLKKSKHYWSNEQEKFLLKNWQHLSLTDIGNKIGKPK